MTATAVPCIRTVLLQDHLGCVQAILEQDSLLELDRVQEASGRALQAVSDEELPRVRRRFALQQLAEAPCFFMTPTLIESGLSGQEQLHYEMFDGGESSLQSVDTGQFRQRIQDQGLLFRESAFSLPGSQLRHKVQAAGNDQEEIRQSLQNFTARRIRQRLEETLEIPPLPTTANRIIRLRDNPNASTTELTRIVEADPGLAAQVVSWAASPYYAAPGKIRSVQDAIVRVLGFDMVSNLALGLILGRNIAVPRDDVGKVTPYWTQAVYCATGVEALFRLLPARQRPRQGLLYLSGLLHNFGLLILAHTFPPHFQRIRQYCAANPGIHHVAIEHHLLGVSREQLSAWLLQRWNLPEELSVALRQQHDPAYSDRHADYARLVYLCTRLLREQGIGDIPPESPPAALFDELGLNEDEARAAIATVAESPDIRHMADQLATASQ